MKRFLFRRINRLVSRLGLQIVRKSLDFDNYPHDQETLGRIFSSLADEYDGWLNKQLLFKVNHNYKSIDAIEQFFNSWMKMPFREQSGGSRFNNLLWLFLISKSLQPTVIVDSGTYQGASAWALSLGCPDCETHSFDIDLSNVKHKCKKPVHYHESDWTAHDFSGCDFRRSLVYFDDHLDQVKRLSEAIKKNFSVAIFDDDFSVTSYFSMAPRTSVLPKIEFVLDSQLKDGQVLRWSYSGRTLEWTVDRAYLDSVKPGIANTERLPNTSLITGSHQTPYRVVAMTPF